MTTIVSGFISNCNNTNINKYIINGTKLILQNINKIIYIEEDLYNNYFKNIDYNKDNTQFRFYNKNDIYLYEYKDKININNISRNRDKDTIDYMFIQCNKTEWLRQAILENYYNTDNFLWIDFGIYHILSSDFSLFNIDNKKYDKIRIGGGIYIYSNLANDPYIYNSICWFFLGGIIGGDKNKLIFFADKVKEKCIEIINTKGIILWEVNIWYLVYKDIDKDYFSIYAANHNESMIDLY